MKRDHFNDPETAEMLEQLDLMREMAIRFDGGEVEPVKRTRQRKPSVSSVIRQMQRAGVEVAGCEINPRDGTIKVLSGKPVGGDITDIDEASPIDRSEWNLDGRHHT
jgi:hypothetical protein